MKILSKTIIVFLSASFLFLFTCFTNAQTKTYKSHYDVENSVLFPQNVLKSMSYIKEKIIFMRAKNVDNFSLNSEYFVNKCIEDDAKEGKFFILEKKFLFDTTSGGKRFSYHINDKRPDGTNVSSPRPQHAIDIIVRYDKDVGAKTIDSNDRQFAVTYGSYYAISDSYHLIKIPFDMSVFVERPDGNMNVGLLGQAGASFSSASYEEKISSILMPPELPLIKINTNDIAIDNGGPEGLVQLSRRRNFPNIYGIDRQDLWKTFNPAQAEFTLDEVQSGAIKLGLEAQVQKLPLSQLQKSGTPALLFLQDDGRIVTLTALDDDRAVIIDRGLTRNVERSVLEARYSGETLIPTKALTQQAGIVADDAVREVQLPSLEAEVPQSVTLRNTGKVPVTLQLEYPLLGVTESKLSKDTLAPGETATLDLKIKWRSILKAPTQNVLVSLQTSDPIVPRLQLAFLLVPPRAAK